jgi:hypothetical protein
MASGTLTEKKTQALWFPRPFGQQADQAGGVFIEDQKTGVDAVRDRLLVPLGNVTSTQGGSKMRPLPRDSAKPRRRLCAAARPAMPEPMMATRWVAADTAGGRHVPCRRPEYKKCCEARREQGREGGGETPWIAARPQRPGRLATMKLVLADVRESTISRFAQETRAVVGDGVPADAWSAGKFMKQRRSLKMSAVAGVVVKMIVRFERRPWCNLRASDTAVPVSGQPVDNCNLNLKRVCTRVRSAWTCGVVRLLCGWLFSLP